MTKPDDMSVAELRAELKARAEKQAVGGATAEMLRDPDLEEVEDAELVQTLIAKQKVIYGVDDRADIFELTDAADRRDADSVAALFRAAEVIDNGDGTSRLATQNFGVSYGLCAGEPFRDQPVGAFCSGFLVGPDVIATAGHCINATTVGTVRFVFGFRMQGPGQPATVIPNGDIYRGVALLGHTLTSAGADWSLVRVDRPVTGRAILPVRREGKIGNTEPVYVIGHPCGLPTKFADGSAVRGNTEADFFVANLDTYGGNSGSPVFNENTRIVEGILVRGERDFQQLGSCRVSYPCPDTGCRGEDCTRATVFAGLLTPANPWRHTDLTAHSNAPLPAGPLHGYVMDQGGTPSQHVVYQGVDGRAHELWWYGHQGWSHTDLTAHSKAPLPAGPLHGYVMDQGGTPSQHVVYQGVDGRAHELWWYGHQGWSHTDLTAHSNAPLPAGPLHGNTKVWNGVASQHVYYQGVDGHAHELWWHPDHGWNHTDLTAHTNAPLPAGPLHGNTKVWNGVASQHVYYQGVDGHAHELWWHPDHQWNHTDLTLRTHAPLPAGPVHGYALDQHGVASQHAVYHGVDGHAHELWWHPDFQWNHTDLTVHAAAPLPAGPLRGYTMPNQATAGQHVVYRGVDGRAHELWWQ
ncbi:trypsin-like serine peptidase [Streptomyces cyaneus]|uniref:trypsin-like serine peptidase n=1 Tax=Streptomyces cyaneus TaxID=1904 RepID=UPI000FF88D3D|nr:serine protease [Streptomyces cyaneus]